MKVGFDLTPIIYQRGVGRYTQNLVKALQGKSEVKLAGFGYSLRKEAKLDQFIEEVGLTTSEIKGIPPSLMGWLWRFGLQSVKRNLPNIELFHSWDWLQPPDKDLPLVSTIHDVALLKFDDLVPNKIKRHHQRSWRILKERNAEIIAVSRATKKDIINLLGIPAYKIHVVHEALPLEFKEASQNLTEEDVDWVKTKFELNQPYLLFVGTREPRKNLKRLVEAWQPFSDDYQLLVAGAKGWDESEQLNQPGLRFLGPVTDQELAVLYGEAELFCYPSLYEGFGLPILEAFLHGTPVVTSDASAMPEVAGNAAELVDPESVESIRAGIEKILNEDLEAQRQRLQRMVLRLQLFSWERVANETLAVYQQALVE